MLKPLHYLLFYLFFLFEFRSNNMYPLSFILTKYTSATFYNVIIVASY